MCEKVSLPNSFGSLVSDLRNGMGWSGTYEFGGLLGTLTWGDDNVLEVLRVDEL
jgi:hypothetical protein